MLNQTGTRRRPGRAATAMPDLTTGWVHPVVFSMRAKCARTGMKLARNRTQTGVRSTFVTAQKPPFWSSTRGSSEHHKCLCALSSEAAKAVRARCKRLSPLDLDSARPKCANREGLWRPCSGARNPRALGLRGGIVDLKNSLGEAVARGTTGPLGRW
jgi:hypothetical protein